MPKKRKRLRAPGAPGPHPALLALRLKLYEKSQTLTKSYIGARLYIIIDQPGPPRGVETPPGPPGAAPFLSIASDTSGVSVKGYGIGYTARQRPVKLSLS